VTVSEPTRTADNGFYSARYSSDRQRLRDVIFAEVYDNYFGQSSWVSTADYDRFAGWLELSSESRLLDIACGSGQPSLRIAAGTGCRVTGVDSSEEAIATAISMAQDKGLASRSRFECADAARPLRYPDASFDALMCIDALAHFSDRRAAFREWSRVLKPGGRLVFTSQVLTGPISNAELAARTPFGYYAIGPDGYDERLIAEAGFRLLARVDLTPTFAQVAERHCAARAAHEQALRSLEAEEEFERQNRYRAIAAQLAHERRLSHFAYLAHKT
jgi:ubiquinone/menaquinone biosynthesis C-methylase UbiE